jgi:hypothetical protein
LNVCLLLLTFFIGPWNSWLPVAAFGGVAIEPVAVIPATAHAPANASVTKTLALAPNVTQRGKWNPRFAGVRSRFPFPPMAKTLKTWWPRLRCE